MKKLIALVLCVLLAVSTLAGCKSGRHNGTLPSVDDMSGTDLAKLLLANQRLNAQQLSNENLFESGTQVYRSLAEKAVENWQVCLLSAVPLGYDDGRVGQFSVQNGTAVWSDFSEYNNSYSYFSDVTKIIVDTALRGADLIDEVKQTVTVVDLWVEIRDEKFYLSVDATSECLLRLTDDELMICRRYTDENGTSVYELYMEQSGVASRVKYIPNERYEWTEYLFDVDQETYFVADHTKGYWETFCATRADIYYGTSFIVMKNDVCYEVAYDVDSQTSAALSIMSADTATDILQYTSSWDRSAFITLEFAGFDGIVDVTAPEADTWEGNLTDGANAVVHLSNGKQIKQDDVYVGGAVQVTSVHVSNLADGYVGSMDLVITGDDRLGCWNAFASFLSEAGLTCRRNWTTVSSGVSVAEEDAANLVNYYRWNGFAVSEREELERAMSAERSYVDSFPALYNAVKDAPILSAGDGSAWSIDFAPLAAQTTVGATLIGGTVCAERVELTVEDTRLLDSGTIYTVSLALGSLSSDALIPIASFGGTAYAGEDRFTVRGERVECNLPFVTDGNYTLVAYLATQDGIRVSECAEVCFETVSETDLSEVGHSVSIQKNSNGSVRLSYQSTQDHVIVLVCEEIHYDAFAELLSVQAFAYGTPCNDLIEVLKGETYERVERGGEIGAGVYRMGYVVTNGNSITSGYVYLYYGVN